MYLYYDQKLLASKFTPAYLCYLAAVIAAPQIAGQEVDADELAIYWPAI